MPTSSALRRTATTSTTQPRIAIVGGGLGGLTVLLRVHKHGIPATLDEREPSIASRRHLGGSLDLGYDTGQRALRENGLEQQFKQHLRPEGDCNMYYDSQRVLSTSATDPNGDPRTLRPEIDRSALRKIMLNAVPPDAIKRGHALSSIRPLGEGEHELTLANGHTAVSDVLVGADGAHSRMRPLVSNAQPIYHGITGAGVSLSPSIAARPELAETVANVNGDGRIRTYLWFPGPEDWTLHPDPDATREKLLLEYEGWAGWMRMLIERCDGEAMYARPLYHLPLDHRREHVRGITILGDVAHLMSPFAGVGANMAMVDAFELGVVVSGAIEWGKNVEVREAAIAAWEERRMREGRRVGAMAARYLAGTFSSGQSSV
ncbi:hypothetical protein V8D89_004895 [Ganoderma adspersum]